MFYQGMSPMSAIGSRRHATPRAEQSTSRLTRASLCLQTCQDGIDQQFIISLAIPVAVAIASVAWLLRPPPKGEDIFEDPDTGAVFQATPGKAPARDRKVSGRVAATSPCCTRGRLGANSLPSNPAVTALHRHKPHVDLSQGSASALEAAHMPPISLPVIFSTKLQCRRSNWSSPALRLEQHAR